ncbi:MAG: DUF488 domain-containing protein [Verrucomicrobia bacterium]|nr:DUF488 domain-containing protein [Verrucomicrobiota bacterium]
MPHSLYTIGYQDMAPADFLRRLREAGVVVLLDVRELAQSRIQGFSKTALAHALKQHDIQYQHIPKLGSPRKLRHELRDSGDFAAFTRGYLHHLGKQGEQLQELQRLAYDRVCCLLCFEKDHEACHRQFIARQIKELGRNGLQIVHL